MEFFVKQSDLLRELQLAQGVMEKKSTIPVLSHVLLQASKFSLQLTSTDLELACRSSCPAKVRADGAVAVHARRLLEIVRSVGDSEIRFRLQENNWLQITCGRPSFKLAGLEGDKFPAMPAVPASRATIPGKTLSGLIERTVFAAGNEENRYTINGALLILKPNSATMVATDGHRLALAECDQQIVGLEKETRLLIPKRALNQARSLVSEAGEAGIVEIGSDDKHHFFSAQGRLLIARMMTGNFPNYESVLPREQKVVLELDAAQVTAAVRRVSLLADEKSNAIHLALLRDRIEISSSGVNYGEATEVLDGQNDLEPTKIGFNYTFLLEFFGVVKKGEKVRMAFKDEMSAVDLVPVQEGFRYRYVVMPMRG